MNLATRYTRFKTWQSELVQHTRPQYPQNLHTIRRPHTLKTILPVETSAIEIKFPSLRAMTADVLLLSQYTTNCPGFGSPATLNSQMLETWIRFSVISGRPAGQQAGRQVGGCLLRQAKPSLYSAGVRKLVEAVCLRRLKLLGGRWILTDQRLIS